MRWIAALPMYDWPELRSDVDRIWETMRARFIANGIDAPESLVRCNADMPPVPGGIRGEDGSVIAPDPSTLDADALDLDVLWRHPALLIAATCWGPMELGLQNHVQVIGQSQYEDVAGGLGIYYSSAIIGRRGEGASVMAPETGEPILPISLFRGRKLAFNEHRSMSGHLALKRDLEAMGEGLGLFSELVETGAHRASVTAVARGAADFAAIDCRSWMLAERYEPAAKDLHVVGWTGRRKGLPFIRARNIHLDFLM
ncbi:phosphate/phosphite/phosphonate ABC transporter substrate-binding protein [Agrobacterium larrymoorei]|uniref:ABC-type phosphate/phosphonate transport system substrate-binding protein n=1 Tax=Agrobacterium larrymoorei TaxID=160699 RepID=A0ABU0UGW5_9HYPH|nr:PhnD/SsuA/transferrin family substrate-binding protein [Agrobacterium larrymoorei]MDQ1184169.1 ABC-type phosphate/phosphonate transport system substrate-binding protein [Agrobacterium larrymoorei]